MYTGTHTHTRHMVVTSGCLPVQFTIFHWDRGLNLTSLCLPGKGSDNLNGKHVFLILRRIMFVCVGVFVWATVCLWVHACVRSLCIITDWLPFCWVEGCLFYTEGLLILAYDQPLSVGLFIHLLEWPDLVCVFIWSVHPKFCGPRQINI